MKRTTALLLLLTSFSFSPAVLGASSTAPTAGGIWAGTMTFDDGTALKVSGEIDENGRGYFVDTRYTIYSSTASIVPDSSGNVAMQFNEFVPASSVDGSQSLGTASFQGTVNVRTTLSGSFSQSLATQGSGTGQFSLSYSSAYGVPSSLSLIANTYRYVTRNNGKLDTVTLTFSSTGAVTGSSESGCVYAGTASLVKTRYNAYEFALTATCGGSVVQSSGLAAYVPTVSDGSYATPPVLLMEYDDAATQAVAIAAFGPVGTATPK